MFRPVTWIERWVDMKETTLLYLLGLLLLRQNLWCIRKVGWAPGAKNGLQLLYCKKYVCKKYADAPLRTWADAGTWKCCQQFPSTRRGTPLDQQSISKTWWSGHREIHRTWTSCRQKGSTCKRRKSFFICLTLCLVTCAKTRWESQAPPSGVSHKRQDTWSSACLRSWQPACRHLPPPSRSHAWIMFCC